MVERGLRQRLGRLEELVPLQLRFAPVVGVADPRLVDRCLLARDRDEAPLVAEPGLCAVRHSLMPLAAALRDFVFQQALGHLQTHFDGKRRQGLARHLQQRFHIERQLHFPGLRQRLLLDPPRPTATTPTTTATR